MKQQQSTRKPALLKWLSQLSFTFIFCCCWQLGLFAQSDLGFDNQSHQVNANGSYQDFIIPASAYKYLYLEARGADGGNRYSNHYNEGGGQGANIGATFSIGSGTNQLAPGGIIRFVIGKAGHGGSGDWFSGGGGGGGTGILYLPPLLEEDDDVSNWKLLVVAGGGGGAAGDCCSQKSSGRPAETGTAGGLGEHWSMGNGTDGHPGAGVDGGGGGGAYAGGEWDSSDHGDNGFNPLPVGGKGQAGSHDGGFGFGGGGAGMSEAFSSGGGGGGGYSGGGGPDGCRAGGGGGSYINAAYADPASFYKKRNGTTTNPRDGYALYRAAAVPVPPQAKQIRLSTHIDKCIDLLYGNTDNGATVGIWDCGPNSPHQYWIYDGNFIRYGADLNKCIDLAGGNTSNGAKIEIWDCQINNENTPHQQWLLDPGTGHFQLKANPSKCLDLNAGILDNGNKIQLWDCQTNNANQAWLLAKKITLASQPDKCIDQLYGNLDNGATVGIWNCGANSPHQFWVYDGNFIRYGADLNKCLDLSDGNTSNGAKVQIWDCQINNENTPHQQWVLEPGTGKIQLKADPSKCLDLYGAYVDNDNGNWLWIWDCMTYAVNQTWIVE